MDELNLFNMIDSEKAAESSDWKWTFADYPKEKNGLKVFSCFACGGGSTMGYKLAGCEVLGCVEIDPKMNEIYVKNHHPKYNFCMDLRDFNKLPKNEIPDELFNLDILDGSPPCTTFSMSGEREDSWGKKKKFREGQQEQTLDDLSFVFIETVKKLKPRVVIMENVEGLILGEAFTYVQQIYKDFQNVGYLVHHWLLKGEQMGVPQTRHRVFFVACRADLGIDPSWLDMSFNYEPVLFGDIKGDDTPPACSDTVFQLLLEANENDSCLADILQRKENRWSRFNEKIIWESKVAPTLVYHGMYRGVDKTKLSELDYKHMQTFPEDYNCDMAKIEYVCGMSVPPVMMKRVVNKLIEQGVFNYAKSMHKMP